MTTQPQADAPMLEQALAYLADELPVFPVCRPLNDRHCEQERSHAKARLQDGHCSKPGKVPLVAWTAYQTRLPTEEEVRDWWRLWPTANIGMATGELAGIVVVDLDNEEARLRAASYGYETGPWVRTGRVGGQHLWFRWHEQAPRNFVKREGIDYRGQGGYVLLPPSLHHSGNPYRWGVAPRQGLPLPPLPAWVQEIAAPTAIEQGGVDFPRLFSEGAGQGSRNQTVFRAAAKLRRVDVPYDVAEGLILQLAARCTPPLDEGEARQALQSAYRRYQPGPAEFTVPDTTQPTEEVGSYPIQTAASLLALAEDNVECLVEGVLWANRITWAFSAPGVGKTLFMTTLGMHVAAGREFCRRPVTQGPVLIIEEDSPLSRLAEYVDTVAGIYGFDVSALPLYVNRDQGLRITDDTGAARVLSAVQSCPLPPILVILDACESLVPSERFTTKELDPLRRCVQQLVTRGISVVVIDHTRKAGTQAGPAPDPMDLLYGGRNKSAMTDMLLHFTGALRTGVHAVFTKARGMELPPPLDIAFTGDEGFTLTDRPQKVNTPTEGKIMRWVNNHLADWYSADEITAGAGVNPHSGRRALNALVKRRWLIKDGTTSDAHYRSNPNLGDVFGS